jgi:hypothetical protein
VISYVSYSWSDGSPLRYVAKIDSIRVSLLIKTFKHFFRDFGKKKCFQDALRWRWKCFFFILTITGCKNWFLKDSSGSMRKDFLKVILKQSFFALALGRRTNQIHHKNLSGIGYKNSGFAWFFKIGSLLIIFWIFQNFMFLSAWVHFFSTKHQVKKNHYMIKSNINRFWRDF